MSIEEKAKAYDEAINKISDVVEAGTIEQGLAEWLFPELKESEGERIRKALIKYFTLSDDNADFQCCGVHYKDIVAWLEAQGEQIPANSAKTCKDEQKPVTEINPSEFDSRLNALLKEFESLSKNELVDSLRFYLNVVENDGTYKEQKPTWSEEDENIRLRLIDYLYGKSRLAKDREDGISWLKSLKDRILPQLKQEWSEEDEKMLDVIITDVNYSQKHFLDSKVIDYNKKTDWLKSLRPQSHWKPSEEQMKMLAKFIDNFDIGRNGKEILKSLYSDLEKL